MSYWKEADRYHRLWQDAVSELRSKGDIIELLIQLEDLQKLYDQLREEILPLQRKTLIKRRNWSKVSQTEKSFFPKAPLPGLPRNFTFLRKQNGTGSPNGSSSIPSCTRISPMPEMKMKCYISSGSTKVMKVSKVLRWSSISRHSSMITIRLIITMEPIIRNVWLMFSAIFRTVSIMSLTCHGILRWKSSFLPWSMKQRRPEQVFLIHWSNPILADTMQYWNLGTPNIRILLWVNITGMGSISSKEWLPIGIITCFSWRIRKSTTQTTFLKEHFVSTNGNRSRLSVFAATAVWISLQCHEHHRNTQASGCQYL